MTLQATCHCGDTKITLSRSPTEAKSCNCSFCERTGAIWGYFQTEEISVEATEQKTYSASGGMNQHHFCGRCGMHTWGDSPDWASVYNADGYYQPNELDAYSINSITGEKGEDGTITLQFGGCTAQTPNCLPITVGWNYMVRLYRPRQEILDGSWSFPAAEPLR